MKNLLLALLFVLPMTVLAQQDKEVELNQYLKKINSKRKTGNVLVITGGGLILTGLLVGAVGNQNQSFIISGSQIAGLGITTLGVLSVLTSVPFYISANNNKRKYLKLSPSASIIPSNSMNENQNYAAIGLKMKF